MYSLVASGIREKRPVTIVDFQARGRLHWESVGKKIGTPFPPPSKASTSTSSPVNYRAPGPETLFDPETDEPSLTGLWEELVGVGIEKTDSGSIPKHGDREDSKSKEEKDRSIARTGNQRDGTTTISKNKDKEENRGGMGLEKGMVILVGFSELICQGFSPEHLARFGRALLGWCRQTQTSLITTLHTPLLLNASSLGDHLSVSPTSDPESDLLLRLLRAGQDGGIWWRVEELKSGRSGVVHGEISVHPLSSRSSVIQKRVPYTSPLQYRLDDNAVRVFPKGTGKGYL